jgi:hypothetical protein
MSREAELIDLSAIRDHLEKNAKKESRKREKQGYK